MKHEWDHDCICIHCGVDGADWPRNIYVDGELVHEAPKMPECPVWNENTRAENRRRNPVDDPFDISENEMLGQEEKGAFHD